MGYLLALLLGLATGVAGVGVHRRPIGLVLAVGTVLVTVWALRQWRRTAVVWFAAGWLVVLGASLFGRPEGPRLGADRHRLPAGGPGRHRARGPGDGCAR
jgi:hypothetical protein